MQKKLIRAALTCAVLLASAGAAQAAPTRIMPLGDSITGSPGCWRALLWNKLQTNGYTNIDMVGTLPAQGCGIPYDGDNEGHGGILATNMASQSQLPPWLAATSPDIVMMHLGTNDVWSGRTNDQILGAFTTLVGQMRAQNPNMKILVAQIIPMDGRSCATCAQGVINLNAAIPAWAAGLSTAQSPITVVDQWTGFDDTTDTGDGVHPNDVGIQKISDRWYPAVVAALGGAQTPSFSLSASPVSLNIALSPNTAGSATSTITVTPSGGFTGSVTLSATAVAGGTVSFSPNPTTATSVMTVAVPANAQPGTYTLTVTGTSGTLTRSAPVSVVVTQVVPQDFTLSVTPTTLSLAQGTSATVSVGIPRIQGFPGSVQLTASGLPAGVTAAFSPNPATGATSTLTLTASSTATVGTANVTVTGTSGSLTHTATLALTVGTTTSTFALSAAPASVTVIQGASGTSTINITRTNYTSAVTLSASGLPAGVTASFSPASTTANTSTLTLAASSTATVAPATVTITGVGATGSLSRTTTVSLVVNASGGTGTAPCSPATSFTGNTNNFNTTGAVCYRTSAKINGWGCYNMDGRTVKANNVAVACGAALPAPWSDGYTYFAATAGTYAWAGIYTW
jgi:lysophospholipase L1-like esterase